MTAPVPEPCGVFTPTPARELWLVRHGETEGCSSIRLFGASNVPLSDEGRAMAARAGAAVRAACGARGAEPVPRVFASRLSRSLESARIVARALGAPAVEAVPEFDEVDFGDWEGLTVEEARRARPDLVPAWEAADDTFRYPGGESLGAFRARVERGLRRVLAAHPDGDVALVLHKGVLKAILTACLGLPFLPVARRFEVDLGSLSRLRLGEPHPSVLRWNEVPR